MKARMAAIVCGKPIFIFREIINYLWGVANISDKTPSKELVG
jgi:hypothetical protein